MYKERYIQCYDSTYLFVDSLVCFFGSMGPRDGNLLFIQCTYVLCSLCVVIVTRLYIVLQSCLMKNKRMWKNHWSTFSPEAFPPKHFVLFIFPLKHFLCFITPSSFVLNIQHNTDHRKQQLLSTDRHKHHTKVVFMIISMKTQQTQEKNSSPCVNTHKMFK